MRYFDSYVYFYKQMGCVTCSPVMEGADGSPVVEMLPSSPLNQKALLKGDPHPQVPTEPFVSLAYNKILQSPEKTFLIDAEDGKEYTYGDLLVRSRCWAQWLRSRGYGKGSIVSISSENNIEGFSVIFGTWLSGASANPFNFNFNQRDIEIMFEVTQPDVIYCSKNIELIEKAAAGRDVPFVTPVEFSSLIKMDVSEFNVDIEDSKTHVVSIMFTSGTTGTPKGVTVPDNSLKNFISSSFLQYSRILATSPFFWVSNTISTSFVLYDQKVIIVPKRGWTLREILETIQTYKPEAWFTGHSVLLEIAHKDFTKEYDLSSLKHVVTGGTMLLANQKREINKFVFNDRISIKHLYGSTEVGIITKWTNKIDINNDTYDSVGALEDGVQIKFIDGEGNMVGEGEPGEIWVQSQSMTIGYLTTNRVLKEAVDEDGWYHTGDLGYYDNNKLLYIIGRIKDILKYKGVQVAPAEIEVVLNSHPEIIESCVVGKFDVVDGDIPVAFVVLKEQSSISLSELQDFVNENIAQVKRPQEIHIIEAIPKSAVGKTLRTELEKIVNNK